MELYFTKELYMHVKMVIHLLPQFQIHILCIHLTILCFEKCHPLCLSHQSIQKKVIRHYKLRETARHNLTVEIQFWYQPQFSTVEPLLSSHPPGHVRQPLNRGLSGIRTELGWNINLINYKHTWMLYDL